MTLEIPSTTTLVLDLLAAKADRKMSAQDLCRAGSIMGYGESPMRVALTRLAQRGKILKLGRATYSLDSQNTRLQLDVENWRERSSWTAPWDGNWIAAHDGAISGQDKTKFRQHQRALTLRGFRKWKPGLHLRPNNRNGGAAALRKELAELGVAAGTQLFVATEFDSKQTAEILRLWNIPGLRRDYAKMIAQLEASKLRLKKLDPASAAREALLVGRGLIGHMLRDPLLPTEMVQGIEFHELAKLIADYQDLSRKIWDQVLSDA